ncbi:hypothetical protein [Nocardia otitidiscaviarum]|uniref:hypothetical protein n=1 Tax=Nocardia otitidiscaviarum TaxID=1823 RepID=UPI002458BD9A|nr:hypothetical protein [Nocardia otitidiscaviarum]
MRAILAAALMALLVFGGGWPAAQADSELIHPATECSAPEPGPWVVDPATVAAPVGPGRPADPGAEQRVRAALANFLACLEDDAERAATLFTPHFIESFMNQRDYASVAPILAGLRMTDMRITAIRVYSDGSLSVEGSFLAYGHKLAHERWHWWPDADGFLRVNGLEPLEPAIAPTAAPVDVEVGDFYYRLDRPVVRTCDGAVVLRLHQTGGTRHEAILFRLPEGADAADLLADRVPPESIVTIAHDNGSDVISLVGLPPGTYTLMSFEPGPDGRPLALHGLTTQFTVLVG